MFNSFSGSYELLKWILRKYKDELPYNGSIMNFATLNHYTQSICSSKWKHNGVGYRVWGSLEKDLVILEKDLVIATLMGKVADSDAKTLVQLKAEYLEETRNIYL